MSQWSDLKVFISNGHQCSLSMGVPQMHAQLLVGLKPHETKGADMLPIHVGVVFVVSFYLGWCEPPQVHPTRLTRVLVSSWFCNAVPLGI